MCMSLTAKRLRLPFPYGFSLVLGHDNKGDKNHRMSRRGKVDSVEGK